LWKINNSFTILIVLKSLH